MIANTMILNQIQFLHKLKEAGFTTPQAETLTEAIATDVVSGLATKEDVKNLKASTKEDFKLIRSEMEADFKLIRSEMETDFKLVRSEMEEELKLLRVEMGALEHRLYWKIMIGMTVLLAIVPNFAKYLTGFLN